jgi:Arc/MetJ-type ribon-helix-helix transcriptional regulator
MSKGNPRVTIRLTQALIDEINACINSRNYHSAEEPWTFSDFVDKAIAEKLAHLKRSRRKKSAESPPHAS